MTRRWWAWVTLWAPVVCVACSQALAVQSWMRGPPCAGEPDGTRGRVTLGATTGGQAVGAHPGGSGRVLQRKQELAWRLRHPGLPWEAGAQTSPRRRTPPRSRRTQAQPAPRHPGDAEQGQRDSGDQGHDTAQHVCDEQLFRP